MAMAKHLFKRRIPSEIIHLLNNIIMYVIVLFFKG